jgi:CBS domain-containing protein
MKVADFMTRKVVTVAPDTPVLTAARLMLEQKVSGLPVLDAAGCVVGIATEHDLIRHDETSDGMKRQHWLKLFIERTELPDEAARFHARTVGDVMTRHPVTVTEATSLEEAGRLIMEHGFKRLPVMRGQELVGIIARADLVRALTQAVRQTAESAERDAIYNARLAELQRQALLYRTRSPR